MRLIEGWKKLATPIKWALGLSILYVLLFFVALFLQTPPNGPKPYVGLLSMEPNELGDLFAGFFAPLAFIWLASTVFIQANELAAQREELAATREELRENRKVSEQNVAFVEAQTKVIEENHERQLEADVDRRFGAAAQRVYGSLRELNGRIVLSFDRGPFQALEFQVEQDRPLFEVVHEVILIVHHFNKVAFDNHHQMITVGVDSKIVLTRMLKDIRVMISLYSQVSPEYGHEYENKSLENLYGNMRELLAVFNLDRVQLSKA